MSTEGEVVAEFDDELVVVGSRARPRSVTESSVPIDAIPVEDVVSQGASSLDYQLRNLVPSFNVATLSDQRRRDAGAAGQSAQPGPRPHAGSRERQAPASLGDPRLVRGA